MTATVFSGHSRGLECPFTPPLSVGVLPLFGANCLTRNCSGWLVPRFQSAYRAHIVVLFAGVSREWFAKGPAERSQQSQRNCRWSRVILGGQEAFGPVPLLTSCHKSRGGVMTSRSNPPPDYGGRRSRLPSLVFVLPSLCVLCLCLSCYSLVLFDFHVPRGYLLAPAHRADVKGLVPHATTLVVSRLQSSSLLLV